MTPKEVADRLERYWPVDGFYTQQHRRENIEKWVQAAIDEATRVRWTKEKPTDMGAWWWRLGPGARHIVRYVILRENTLCVEVNGCPLDVESVGGEWSDKPIQEPSDE